MSKLRDRVTCSNALKFWSVGAVLALFLYFFNWFELRFLPVHKVAVTLVVKPQDIGGYLVNTAGCRIPDLNPFDDAVRPYIFSPPPIDCSKKPVRFDADHTSIIARTNLSCCYQEFKRVPPPDFTPEGGVEYETTCHPLTTPRTHVNSSTEFVRVTCRQDRWQDFFAFVPEKPPARPGGDVTRPNILIIGLDAVSRNNLHRQLPKTYRFLKDMLGAEEMLGYNKVADNTFVNLVPVLTGLFESELKNTCWPNTSSHLDRCPFVWKRYASEGYRTALGEDCAAIGTFAYQKNGFQHQDVDYYYTTLRSKMEDAIGYHKDFNCYDCVGGRRSFADTLNYIDKFTHKMQQLSDAPYFAFFWTNSLSHDYLNKPALGDPDFYQLFHTLHERGRLDNTVFIFMSDHGIRWGDIRTTYQGQLEERLPFLFISLPQGFKQHQPSAVRALKVNTRRLTTPFDLHATLLDLLDVNTLGLQKNQRSYSLFKEIPWTRTCASAEIEDHWCTCQESAQINVTDSLVVKAALHAVGYINRQLEGYGQCARLQLDRVVNARVLTHATEHITDKHGIVDYTVTFETVPGRAVFETTVRWRGPEGGEERSKKTVEKFDVTGTISRINSYGKQSSCIMDFHLKLYCYCKKLFLWND